MICYIIIYIIIYIHATSCYIFSMFDSSIIQPDVSDAHVAHPLSGAPLGALCLPHPDQLLGFVDTNIYGILYSVLRNITRLSGADELQNAGESAGDCSHVGGAVGTPSWDKLRTSIKPPFLAWFGQSHISLQAYENMQWHVLLGNKQALIPHQQKLVTLFFFRSFTQVDHSWSTSHWILLNITTNNTWSLPRCQTRFEEKIHGIQSSITGIQEGHYFSPRFGEVGTVYNPIWIYWFNIW